MHNCPFFCFYSLACSPAHLLHQLPDKEVLVRVDGWPVAGRRAVEVAVVLAEREREREREREKDREREKEKEASRSKSLTKPDETLAAPKGAYLQPSSRSQRFVRVPDSLTFWTCHFIVGFFLLQTFMPARDRQGHKLEVVKALLHLFPRLDKVRQYLVSRLVVLLQQAHPAIWGGTELASLSCSCTKSLNR